MQDLKAGRAPERRDRLPCGVYAMRPICQTLPALTVWLLGVSQALSASVTEDELSADNTAVALVGQGTPFTILEGDALKPYLAALKADDDAPPPGASQLPSSTGYRHALKACMKASPV